MSSQNQLQVINQQLTSKDVTNRVALALGLDPADEKTQNEAYKYASSVLAEIKKTAGDSKRDLTVCSPESICQTMIDAAQFRLAIDGKQHAHIVKYGNKAQLQIGYRGYIAKISEHYKDADFVAEPVFNSDKLSMTDEGGFQSYKLVKGDPFADTWDDLKGVLVRISYTKGGEKFQKVTVVGKGDLNKIRKAAKTDYIWAQWPIEKAKAAAIKRACKIQFSDVMGLQQMIRYDNEANYELTTEEEASPVRGGVVDKINESLAPDEVEEIDEDPDVIDVEATVVPDVDVDALIKAGDAAAGKGLEAYLEWTKTLSADEKEPIAENHSRWCKKAKEVDGEGVDLAF